MLLGVRQEMYTEFWLGLRGTIRKSDTWWKTEDKERIILKWL